MNPGLGLRVIGIIRGAVSGDVEEDPARDSRTGLADDVEKRGKRRTNRI